MGGGCCADLTEHPQVERLPSFPSAGPVAVKKLKSLWAALPGGDGAREELLKSFAIESEALMELRHKNILYYYGCGFETPDGGGAVVWLILAAANFGQCWLVLCNPS